MNDLLDALVAAHGGAERWRSVSAITGRGSADGLLPKRFPGNKLARFTVQVDVAEPRTILRDFPTRRRVLPLGPGGRVLPFPTLLGLHFDEIEVQYGFTQ
jgi:hypothetical protein